VRSVVYFIVHAAFVHIKLMMMMILYTILRLHQPDLTLYGIDAGL